MAAVALAGVLLFGVFVWPTRWRFERVGSTLVRIDRSSGRTAILDPDRGWIPIPEGPGARNPFDDIAAQVNGEAAPVPPAQTPAVRPQP